VSFVHYGPIDHMYPGHHANKAPCGAYLTEWSECKPGMTASDIAAMPLVRWHWRDYDCPRCTSVIQAREEAWSVRQGLEGLGQYLRSMQQ
jgi:hypothetical protein